MRWRRESGWCINNHGHVWLCIARSRHRVYHGLLIHFSLNRILSHSPILSNKIVGFRPREKTSRVRHTWYSPFTVPRHFCFSSFDSVSERAPRRPDTLCLPNIRLKLFFFSLFYRVAVIVVKWYFNIHSSRLPVTVKPVSELSLFKSCVTTWSTKFNRVSNSYNTLVKGS